MKARRRARWRRMRVRARTLAALALAGALAIAAIATAIVLWRRAGAPPAGGTCDPARAVGAVPPAHRALLDTIATTEGTYHDGNNDGYDVTFGYHYIDDCTDHPAVVHCRGSLCSDAAGRYQFLSATWQRLGHVRFYPDDQDRAAMELLARRGAVVPDDRALPRAEFVEVMSVASWEWASLPPGRYGQPSVTMDRAWAIYQALAGGE